MKRLFLTLMISLLIVALIGCTALPVPTISSPSDTETEEASVEPTIVPTETPLPEFSLDTANVFADYAEITVSEIYAAETIVPPVPGMIYTNYAASSSDKTYLDIVTTLKYLGAESSYIDEVVTLSVQCGGTDYTGFSTAETDEGSNFSGFEQIAPLSTMKVHFLTEIPKAALEGEITATFTVNGESLTASFMMADVAPEKNYIAINDVLEYPEVSQLTVLGIQYATILEPPNASGYYTYFEIEDPNNIYLIISAEVKNLKGTDLGYDKIAGVSAMYDEKYNYNGFLVFEEDGGSSLSSYTSIYGLTPLQTNKVYFLVEMPKEVQDGSVEVTINYGGEKYYIAP